MSTAQLYRKIKALTNFKPVDLIRHIRLERAAYLLRQQAGNVAEVAYQVGFNNLSYFVKVFKEKFDVLSGEFLKTMKLNHHVNSQL
jgi:AraC-like DNA-binding protein